MPIANLGLVLELILDETSVLVLELILDETSLSKAKMIAFQW